MRLLRKPLTTRLWGFSMGFNDDQPISVWLPGGYELALDERWIKKCYIWLAICMIPVFFGVEEACIIGSMPGAITWIILKREQMIWAVKNQLPHIWP
jgi:hypothetical protein